MSNVKVVDLDLRNDNTVFAATYGRGIFSGQFTAAPLSSNDNFLNKGIKVYPNPSNGTFSIRSESEVINVRLVNSLGSEIQSDWNKTTEGIHFSSVAAAGNYILSIETVEGTLQRSIQLAD